MSSDAENIFKQALKLTPEQKLALIELLWDTIANDHLPALTPEQVAELERRERLYEAHPERLIPGDVVMERVRARLAELRKVREAAS